MKGYYVPCFENSSLQTSHKPIYLTMVLHACRNNWPWRCKSTELPRCSSFMVNKVWMRWKRKKRSSILKQPQELWTANERVFRKLLPDFDWTAADSHGHLGCSFRVVAYATKYGESQLRRVSVSKRNTLILMEPQLCIRPPEIRKWITCLYPCTYLSAYPALRIPYGNVP